MFGATGVWGLERGSAGEAPGKGCPPEPDVPVRATVSNPSTPKKQVQIKGYIQFTLLEHRDIVVRLE